MSRRILAEVRVARDDDQRAPGGPRRHDTGWVRVDDLDFGEERGDEVACGSRRHDDLVPPWPTGCVFDDETSQRCTIAESQHIADERWRAPPVSGTFAP